MMQSFRISDALRCILLNTPKGPNLACPRESFSTGTAGWWPVQWPRNPRLWKEVLVQRQGRVTLAWWERINLEVLASARWRSGPRVWEVDHLYLRTDDVESALHGERPYSHGDTLQLELLEGLVQSVGQQRAQRIFLRLPAHHPVIELVRRAGFFPYFEETLLVKPVLRPTPAKRPGLGSQANGASSISLDARMPQDDYGLFQLFSAATPSQVRVALGLTFDQWRDAMERPRQSHGLGRSKEQGEWVMKSNDKITGWLRLLPRHQWKEGELLVHPQYTDLLPALVEVALARGGSQRWLVPDYQESLRNLLRYHGFHEVACYTMLVKTVAARVTSHGMVPVEA